MSLLVQKKKRSLKQKQKLRRKDAIRGMPFSMAFLGDPSRDFRCESWRSFILIPRQGYRKFFYWYGMALTHSIGFQRLIRYGSHRVAGLMECNQIFIERAELDDDTVISLLKSFKYLDEILEKRQKADTSWYIH